MTLHMSQSSQHIADLLAAYVNSRLDATNEAQVRAHLEACEVCSHELAAWEAVSGAARFATAAMPLPSTNVMLTVWEKIDAREKAAAQQKSIKRAALHLWLVFSRQIPLVHKSIWIASALVNVLMCSLVLIGLNGMHERLHSVEGILAFFTTIAAATGVAFLYQTEQDAGYEIILSTPTSIRIIMIFRMLLVVGYNFALAAISSSVIALALGGNLWDFLQIWLGPMMLLASISLTVSVTLGAVVGFVVSLIVEILQALAAPLERFVPALQFFHANLWRTTPVALLLALTLFAFAVYYAPRQPRLSRS